MAISLDGASVQPTDSKQEVSRRIDINKDIPDDIWEVIASNLSQKDLQAAVVVNKALRKNVTELSNREQPDLIKAFIHTLLGKIKTRNLKERWKALSIAQSVTHQNCSNLSLLKGYILGIKEELIDVIKPLDVQIAHHIRSHGSHPCFFEDIFD